MKRVRRAAMSALSGTFLRDAGVLTAAEVVAAAMAAMQGVLVARWLGPAGYGLVALVTAVPATLFAVLSPDSVHATIRFLADRDVAGDRAGALGVVKLASLVDAVVGGTVLVLVAAGAGIAARELLHSAVPAWLLVVSAAGQALAAPAEAAAAIILHGRRFGLMAGARVGGDAFRTILVVTAVGAGLGVEGAVVAGAVASALVGAVTLLLGSLEARREWGGWWLSGGLGRAAWRGEMLRFLAWTDLGGLLGAVTKQVDVVILGAVAGPAQSGHYRLARSLASVVGYVVGPLQAAVYPRFAQLWAAGAGLGGAVRRHASLGGTIAAFSLFGVAAVGPLIRLTVGAQFAAAIPMARLLLLGSLVWAAFYWLRPFYMATGQVRFWVGVSAGMAGGSLVVFGPAAAAWGGTGMAVVQLGAALLGHAIAASRVPSLLLRVPSDAALHPVRPS